MDPEYPQDEQPGPVSKVPSLIHDYRAQREAWREQARNLARMREEVLTAADHEARGIVSAARADVRRILLKARRDLLVLAAQVRAAGRLGDGDDTVDTFNFLPSNDLGQAQNALTTARHDIRRVLDESRPELEGLASEGDALRAALHHHRPGAPAPADVHRRASTLPIQDVPQNRFSESPIDFDFTTIGADESPEFAVRHAGMLRALILVDALGLRIPGVPAADLFQLEPAQLRAVLFAAATTTLAHEVAPDTPPAESIEAMLKARQVFARFAWQFPDNPKLASYLYRVKCPTLIVWGERDGVVPVAHGQLYQAEIPGAECAVLPSCGHVPHVEQAEAFAATVLKYLERIGAHA